MRACRALPIAMATGELAYGEVLAQRLELVADVRVVALLLPLAFQEREGLSQNVERSHLFRVGCLHGKRSNTSDRKYREMMRQPKWSGGRGASTEVNRK